jgi:hypothetical protein
MSGRSGQTINQAYNNATTTKQWQYTDSNDKNGDHGNNTPIERQQHQHEQYHNAARLAQYITHGGMVLPTAWRITTTSSNVRLTHSAQHEASCA